MITKCGYGVIGQETKNEDVLDDEVHWHSGSEGIIPMTRHSMALAFCPPPMVPKMTAFGRRHLQKILALNLTVLGTDTTLHMYCPDFHSISILNGMNEL